MHGTSTVPIPGCPGADRRPLLQRLRLYFGSYEGDFTEATGKEEAPGDRQQL